MTSMERIVYMTRVMTMAALVAACAETLPNDRADGTGLAEQVGIADSGADTQERGGGLRILNPPVLDDLDTVYPVGSATLGPDANGTYPSIKVPFDPTSVTLKEYSCAWYGDPASWSDEERTLRAATDLQTMLEEMICDNTCSFPIEQWDRADPLRNSGILVGTAEAFAIDAHFAPLDSLNREQHRKRSFEHVSADTATASYDGILLVGVNALSVENAVWDFLRGLGYRHPFPTPRWEIAPYVGPTDVIDLDTYWNPADPITPGFSARAVSVGNPQLFEDATETARCDEFDRWKVQNSYRKGLEVGNTHVWTRIAMDLQSPEWNPSWLTDGQNQGAVATGSIRVSEALDADGNCDTGALADPSTCPQDAWHPNFDTGDLPDCFCDMEYAHGSKFCADYPGLKDELWEWVLADLTDPPNSTPSGHDSTHTTGVNHTQDMFMFGMSDGAGWNACAAGQSGGLRPTDRMLALTNDVASRLRASGLTNAPPWISAYAYSYASRPPSPAATVDPDIYFIFTDGFTWEGRGALGVVDAWRAGGHAMESDFGVYDYFLSYQWQLPGGLSAVSKRATDVKNWHAAGATGLIVERQGGWGNSGLALYASMELSRNASRAVAAKVGDFFATAFPANDATPTKPVRSWFRLLDPSAEAVLLSADLVAELYTLLDEALSNTDPVAFPDRAGERERVLDLVAYTRHLDLHLRHVDGTGTEAEVYEHAYQTHICEDRWMVDYYVMTARTYPEGHPDEAAWTCDSSWTETNHAAWITAGTDATRTVLSTCDPGIANCTSYTNYSAAVDVSSRYPAFEDLGRPGATPSAGAGLWSGNQIRPLNLANAAVLKQDDDNAWRLWVDPSVGFQLTLKGGPADVTNPSAYQGNITLSVVDGADPTLEYCSVTNPPDRVERKVLLETGNVTVLSSTGLPSLSAGDTGDPFVAGGDFEFSGTCDASFVTPGFYRVVLENLEPGLEIRFARNEAVPGSTVHAARYDVPDVPADRQQPGWLTDARWFYVPESLAHGEVILWTIGPCDVYRGGDRINDTIVVDKGPTFVRIPTVDANGVDHAGEFWEYRTCKQVYLINVPPYTGDSKEEVLLPCSITDAGLAMNSTDCPP